MRTLVTGGAGFVGSLRLVHDHVAQPYHDLVNNFVRLMEHPTETGPVNIGNLVEFTMIEVAEHRRSARQARRPRQEATSDDASTPPLHPKPNSHPPPSTSRSAMSTLFAPILSAKIHALARFLARPELHRTTGQSTIGQIRT